MATSASAKRQAPGASGAARSRKKPEEIRGPRIRVRMYRQGLGDCFLVSVLREPAPPFHMLIDCGVILGTPKAAEELRAVLGDVLAEVKEQGIDVLVVTHEHYDHVSGFLLAQDLFTSGGRKSAGKLSVGEVWFAWTEDPVDELGRQLRNERREQVRALGSIANQLHLAGAEQPAGLEGALAFFGLAADGSATGGTAKAMENAAGFASSDRVRYHQPGTILRPPGAPEIQVYVLGPPRSRKSLMKRDASAGVFHADVVDLAEAVQLALDQEDGGDDPARPFEQAWEVPLSRLAKGKETGAVADFLRAHYYGPADPTPDNDTTWRRIDGDWLASSSELALALDSATNNTSLAFAIELVGSGKVLLFPGDAQVGNWLSWQDLRWSEHGCAADVNELLAKTVFYKVGHHGSHNATLKEQGLERMPSTGLVAFIPVDHEMALKKRWSRMPLPALVEALKERCGDGLVRIDEEPAGAAAGISAGGTGRKFKSLYFDWQVAL